MQAYKLERSSEVVMPAMHSFIEPVDDKQTDLKQIAISWYFEDLLLRSTVNTLAETTLLYKIHLLSFRAYLFKALQYSFNCFHVVNKAMLARTRCFNYILYSVSL